MGLIYQEQTQLLIGALFDVHNEVGLGRDEEDYHRALVIWLEETGVPYCSKPSYELTLNDEIVHTFIPDIVAWDIITLELKSVPRSLREREFVQIHDYLKIRNDQLGLLANMGLNRVCPHRIVRSYNSYEKIVDVEYWSDLYPHCRDIAYTTLTAINEIYEEHRTGYGAEVTGKLIRKAIKQEGLDYVERPMIESAFRGRCVGKSALDCMIVRNDLLLVYSALFENNEFNVRRGLSFMSALGVSAGIAVNFGKTHLQIKGLRLK